MGNSKRNVGLFIFLSLVIISTVAYDGQEKQTISHRFRDMYSLVASSSVSSWQNLKSLVTHVQEQYFPPNLEPVKVEEEIDDGGAKEWMKEAAKKSFGSSKSTVEETAKTAGSAVGKVVHKTKEKVAKKQCSGDACAHDEL